MEESIWKNIASQVTDHARKFFTKASFMIWAKTKHGFTETQSSVWWLQFHDDPSIIRDNSGLEGAEVLYIGKWKNLTNRTEVYIDGKCEAAPTSVGFGGRDPILLRQSN